MERGRPSVRFVLTRPPVLFPAIAVLISLAAMGLWQELRRDHAAPREAIRLFDQASEAMTAASPMRAVDLLQKAIRIDPKFITARSLLAVAHSDTDQLDLAKDALLEANETRSKRWALGQGEAIALDAATAAVQHNFPVAAAQYQRLSGFPGDREFAILSLARIQDQMGKSDAAIQTLEKALQNANGKAASPAARVRLAALLCRKRQYAKAATLFAQAESVYGQTNNPEGLCDLWISRALNLQTQGYEADRKDLERAIALSAKLGNRYQNMAARLRMVTIAESGRDYETAIRMAREVATEAQNEGMLGMAARATGELGYAFVFAKDNEQATAVLRQAVELVLRAKSYATLASNRMRLAESLGVTGHPGEGIAVMEPAVQWYRQAGIDNVIPLILLKWGTVLNDSSRYREGEAAFRDAYDLAGKNGETMYQAMAIGRLISFHHPRNVRKALGLREQALALARETQMTGTYFNLAVAAAELGEFESARKLIEEGEAEISTKFTKGPDQAHFLSLVRVERARLDQYQGRCGEAATAARNVEDTYQRIQQLSSNSACKVSRSALQSDLVWLERRLAINGTTGASAEVVGDTARYAGLVALRLKDWSAAKRFAVRGIDASGIVGRRVDEMECTLVLRAAEAQLGNRAEAARLSNCVLALAREVGFENPSDFDGRQDLLATWRLGNVSH